MVVFLVRKTHIGHCSLGRIIPDQPRTGSLRTRRGDIDHGAALALLNQPRHNRLDGQENALDVDVEHAVEFCLGDF